MFALIEKDAKPVILADPDMCLSITAVKEQSKPSPQLQIPECSPPRPWVENAALVLCMQARMTVEDQYKDRPNTSM